MKGLLPPLNSSDIASLIPAIKPGGAAAGAPGATKGGKAAQDVFPPPTDTYIIDARRDVPLGFYEPIIATDPGGRKFLFAWRYVGFMPFAGGCPVNPCLRENVVDCSPDDLYGMIATRDSIKFQKLSEIREGYVGRGDKTGTPYYHALPIKDATPGR